MPNCLFLYPIRARYRVFENAKGGGVEGEYHKGGSEQAEQKSRESGMLAGNGAIVEPSRFTDKGYRCRQKENGNIDPVGRGSYYAVVGVKEEGDQGKTYKDALAFYAPKVCAFTKKASLYQGVEEHRPEKQLHMLPSRFVYTREGCDPCRFSQPFVQKMQNRAAERGHAESEKLPKSY